VIVLARRRAERHKMEPSRRPEGRGLRSRRSPAARLDGRIQSSLVPSTLTRSMTRLCSARPQWEDRRPCHSPTRQNEARSAGDPDVPGLGEKCTAHAYQDSQ